MAIASTHLSGNLTRDPELKFTKTGLAVANISVAVSRKPRDSEEEITSFFDCVIWGKLGEQACEILTKGTKGVVTGRLEQRSWEDKDSGQKRSKVELVVDEIGAHVIGLESITRRQFQAGGAAPAPKAAQPSKSYDEEPF